MRKIKNLVVPLLITSLAVSSLSGCNNNHDENTTLEQPENSVSQKHSIETSNEEDKFKLTQNELDAIQNFKLDNSAFPYLYNVSDLKFVNSKKSYEDYLDSELLKLNDKIKAGISLDTSQMTAEEAKYFNYTLPDYNLQTDLNVNESLKVENIINMSDADLTKVIEIATELCDAYLKADILSKLRLATPNEYDLAEKKINFLH